MPRRRGDWVGKGGFLVDRQMGGFDKTWAWWYLSRRQKAVLAEERRKGRFGGMVGKAPYLWIQEEGLELVHIRPQYFLQRAVNHLLSAQGEIIKRHLHG